MQSSASSFNSSRILKPVQPMSQLMEATKARFASLSPLALRNRIGSKKEVAVNNEDQQTEDPNTTVASIRSNMK